MGSLTLSIAGSSSTEKSLTIKSNTTGNFIIQSAWSINDSLFTDTPTTDGGWSAFKANYVTEGTGDNNINVDLAQWAADNGSVAGGALHSFSIQSGASNSDGCKAVTQDNTIEVEAAAAAIPLPSVPTGLTVNGVLFGANATWNASTNAASYVFNYALSDGTGTNTEVVVTPTSHDVVGTLLNADNYDFRVKARNVTGDSSFSAVITIKPFNFREADAECHHVLGDDNTTYKDINSTHTLTATGTGHTNSAGFSSTPETQSIVMSGLLSNTADLAVDQTVIVVGKMYPSVGGTMVLGNQTTSGTAGGLGIFEQSATGTNYKKLFISNRGTGGFQYITRPPDNTWYMVGYSLTGSTRKTFYQDSTMSTPLILNQTGVSLTTSTPARDLGFGNTSYNSANSDHGMHIAEGIIINAAKTDAEFSAIYARSVARLGLRGITL